MFVTTTAPDVEVTVEKVIKYDRRTDRLHLHLGNAYIAMTQDEARELTMRMHNALWVAAKEASDG